jgi:hypothetical protein
MKVTRVLEEIEQLEQAGRLTVPADGTSRRAVVFYVDKGSGFLAYLTWWLYTWRTIRLNSEGTG